MNVMIAQKLPEIFSLARERTEPARMRLAGLLADVFLENGELTPREQVMVNEIIDELVGNTTPQVKQLLSERLATSGTAPHRVLLNLANDDHIEVAAPVLRTNAQLRDEDLIYVVEAHGRDHAMAVAERLAISEAVADALIATGEVDVMTAVAENLGATLSPRALSSMIDASRFSRKLHMPLINRPELNADMGLRMVWWLDTELRRKVVTRFGIAAGQIENSLETAITDMLGSLHDGADTAAMTRVIEWMEERNALNTRNIVQVLRMGFFKLFVMILARRTQMDAQLVEMIVTEDGGRSMSVLCRALGVDKPSFVSIFLLSRGCRPGEQIVNPKELSLALAAFDKIDSPTARDLLEGWRRDPSYLLNRYKQAVH